MIDLALGEPRYDDGCLLDAFLRKIAELKREHEFAQAEVEGFRMDLEAILEKHRVHPQNPIATPFVPPPEPEKPMTRVEHLTTLLNEALELFGDVDFDGGSKEWVWVQVATAAANNTCAKCSAPCDEEGDCVSPDCCFGRSKLAQVNAAAVK